MNAALENGSTSEDEMPISGIARIARLIEI